MSKRLAGCTLTLLIAGCGSPGPVRFQPSPLLGAAWAPAPEQVCTVLNEPEVLPEPESLIDPRAARDVFSGSAAGDGAARFAVLEIVFDSLGARERVVVLDSNLSETARGGLTGAVAARSPLEDAPPRSWGVLLRIDAAPAARPELRVGRMESCSCSLVNRARVVRLMQQAAGRLRNPALSGTRHTIVVDVRSDSSGRITETRLQQVSQHAEVNRIAAEVIPQMKIAAPTLNRRPVDRWSRIPLNFVFPEREPPAPLRRSSF